jgi:hypothetical protein
MASRVAAALAALVASSVFAQPAPAAAAEPTGYAYFHTFAETVALLDTTVASHPDLAEKFSIGTSYQGRQIWALRLTADQDAGTQGKPEVLIEGLFHARERASSELAIYMIGVLTDNYGQQTKLGRRVTAILDSTVVYVIPMVNPDGAVFDFKGGRFHQWRKNRQPLPDSDAVGVDLNRQFGFKWNCCGGSSDDPYADTYHGPEAWFAPEAQALRDFIDSRVADGGRLTEELSLHSAARRVPWPYGYTTEDVPETMTQDDHATFVALGQGMASRNGYTAEQSSDMYVTDGDAGDWSYHEHGIFNLVVEMAKGSAKRYYPSLSELSADLDRNRPAVLWLLEQAACPYEAAGLGARCAATATWAAGVRSRD